MPEGLKTLRHVLSKGLNETAALWPPVKTAYRWVHRVARLLENKKKIPAKNLRRGLSQILTKMRQAARQSKDEALREQLQTFVKVTKSYWPGLFRCYESIDIPRTNNDLEHLFGSYRYHERRASGRKGASASLVVKGGSRIVAELATRQRPEEGIVLPKGYVETWQRERVELEKRREARRQQRRFRHWLPPKPRMRPRPRSKPGNQPPNARSPLIAKTGSSPEDPFPNRENHGLA